MPKIDLATVPTRQGSGYPSPFDVPCAARTRRRLGDAGGLRDFGVNLMTLPPGGWSSQRHWHSHEDELVYVLEGELTLVEDGGETVLRADATRVDDWQWRSDEVAGYAYDSNELAAHCVDSLAYALQDRAR